ncbi:MAG: 4-(cytidine 5'-diphospho)-2-C-methyl-D-erythritol kinase [Peptostreptococcaceae bacterium]|nr:4-(cytidine 5'-diphospho)-2-C-methyl-D-erythritol kinase [Peptostreptococcaceae bacterium]
MSGVKVTTRGKVNISIDVLNKRDDGFHNVEMIMQTLDIKDYIYIKELESDIIKIDSDCPFIPCNEENLVYKAANLIKKTYGIKKGLSIIIDKHIPVAAGMAGGSSNAAGVLKALNFMWNLNIEDLKLKELAATLGSDIPFCIDGGAALATNKGEKLKKVNSLENVWVLISKPSISISTPWVYKNLNLNDIKIRPNTNKILQSLESNDIYEISKEMVNVLETVTLKECKDIDIIKNKMIEFGALNSMMTGSGPTVFGFFKNYKQAKDACLNLKKFYKHTLVTKTFSGGIEIERWN